MRELINEIYEAKKNSTTWDADILLKYVKRIQEDNPHIRILWDWNSGIDVCGLAINDKLIAYIHSRCPICFAKKEFEKYMEVFGSKLWLVLIEDFYKDEWHVDLNKLAEIAPEVSWCASKDAVDPDKFSIDGFKFATQ
jgi:hypothetical protein